MVKLIKVELRRFRSFGRGLTAVELFKETAEEYGDVIQKLPLLGEVTFTSKDIDKLYRLIQYDN